MNTDNQRWKLLELAAHLRACIKGQDHVIERVVSVLQRGELGLAHQGRPKGSFLFVGPTGQATHCTSFRVLYGS
jgi:ATP-dependent Clp protease ATP-binding subunit ClpB